MQQLNFLPYSFRFKSRENKISIFDEIRKKFVILTPEEWVRQHVIRFLTEKKQYPKSLISVEKEITLHQTKKRYDIVVYNSDGNIRLIVECKAPSITISQETFDQIARYNLSVKADYLMVTNGLEHFYCQLDYSNECYLFLEDIPVYKGS